MTDTPRVTVVTSTWKRPRTVLDHAIASVNRQSYPNIEHLIVIDGDDAEMRTVLEGYGYQADVISNRRYTFLGRNWSSFSGNGSTGAAADIAGAWLASGDLITYLDDDNDFESEHIQGMVRVFTANPEADFVLGCLKQWGHSDPKPEEGHCEVNAIMHTAKALQKAGGFLPDGGSAEHGWFDQKMIGRWLAAGLTWAPYTQKTVSQNPRRFGAPD